MSPMQILVPSAVRSAITSVHNFYDPSHRRDVHARVSYWLYTGGGGRAEACAQDRAGDSRAGRLAAKPWVGTAMLTVAIE
jgi:hypothetical protein